MQVRPEFLHYADLSDFFMVLCAFLWILTREINKWMVEISLDWMVLKLVVLLL